MHPQLDEKLKSVRNLLLQAGGLLQEMSEENEDYISSYLEKNRKDIEKIIAALNAGIATCGLAKLPVYERNRILMFAREYVIR